MKKFFAGMFLGIILCYVSIVGLKIVGVYEFMWHEITGRINSGSDNFRSGVEYAANNATISNIVTVLLNPIDTTSLTAQGDIYTRICKFREEEVKGSKTCEFNL